MGERKIHGGSLKKRPASQPQRRKIKMANPNDVRFRVTAMLTEEEKEALQELAWNSQRSISGYLRYMVIREIETYMEYQDGSER